MVRKKITSTVRLDLVFADTNIVVREFTDGMWTLTINDDEGNRLLATEAQFKKFVEGMDALKRGKGW